MFLNFTHPPNTSFHIITLGCTEPFGIGHALSKSSTVTNIVKNNVHCVQHTCSIYSFLNQHVFSHQLNTRPLALWAGVRLFFSGMHPLSLHHNYGALDYLLIVGSLVGHFGWVTDRRTVENIRSVKDAYKACQEPQGCLGGEGTGGQAVTRHLRGFARTNSDWMSMGSAFYSVPFFFKKPFWNDWDR